MNEIVKQKVQETDSNIAAYIKATVEHLTDKGENIEDYALVVVQNPMELKGTSVRITSQWRIVKTSDLENLPTYEEEL